MEEIEGRIGLYPEQERLALRKSLLQQGEGFVVLAEHGVEPGERNRGNTPGSRLFLKVS
jgi:hypothetical protein